MTFIRHEVGGMNLTPNIKMERPHVECARLRHITAAMRGFLLFGASVKYFRSEFVTKEQQLWQKKRKRQLRRTRKP